MFYLEPLGTKSFTEYSSTLGAKWLKDSRIVEIIGQGRFETTQNKHSGAFAFKRETNADVPYASTGSDFAIDTQNDIEQRRNAWKTQFLTHGSAIGGLQHRDDFKQSEEVPLPGSSGYFVYPEGSRKPYQSLQLSTAGHVIYPPSVLVDSKKDRYECLQPSDSLGGCEWLTDLNQSDVVGNAVASLPIRAGEQIFGDAVILNLTNEVRTQIERSAKENLGRTPADVVFTIGVYSGSLQKKSRANRQTIPLPAPQVRSLLTTKPYAFRADRIEAVLEGDSNLTALRTPSKVAVAYHETGTYFLDIVPTHNSSVDVQIYLTVRLGSIDRICGQDVKIGDRVVKTGYATGVTTGTIIADNVTVFGLHIGMHRSRPLSCLFSSGYLVRGDENKPFAMFGDSGGPVMKIARDNTLAALGMVLAVFEVRDLGWLTLVQPIQPILKALKVNLWTKETK